MEDNMERYWSPHLHRNFLHLSCVLPVTHGRSLLSTRETPAAQLEHLQGGGRLHCPPLSSFSSFHQQARTLKLFERQVALCNPEKNQIKSKFLCYLLLVRNSGKKKVDSIKCNYCTYCGIWCVRCVHLRGLAQQANTNNVFWKTLNVK